MQVYCKLYLRNSSLAVVLRLREELGEGCAHLDDEKGSTPNMKRLVSGAIAAALTFSPVAGVTVNTGPLSLGETQRIVRALTQVNSASAVAVADRAATDIGWTIDSATSKGGEVLEITDGVWRHLKAGASNGNSTTDASQYPIVAANDGTFDFTQAGEYHAIIKSPQDGSKNRFGFYLGYKNPNSGLFIGFDKDGWFWQRYGGDGTWYSGSRVAAPAANVETQVDITWTGTTATLTVDGTKAFDVPYSAMVGVMSDKLAMKASAWGSELTDMYLRDQSETQSTYAISGVVRKSDGTPISGARVRMSGQTTVTTGADGAWSFADLPAGEYTITVGASGYQEASKTVQVVDADVSGQDVTLSAAAAYETEKISSEDMDVLINKHFPSVQQYTMKKLDNRIMYGQANDIRKVNINGTEMQLTDDNVTLDVAGSKATYVLTVQNQEQHIDAKITVVMEVKGNALHFDVTKIENKAGDEHPIQTLSFPEHSLISVRSSQQDAQFTGARMSSNTTVNGDTNFPVNDDTTIGDKGDYAYGFISADSLSAGLWSNSEHDGTTAANGIAGGSQNTRVQANTQVVDGDNSLGLSSAPWYYQRVVKDSKKRSYTVSETDMPKMAVAITGDENSDGVVNWQDGALAYRTIMNNPYKSEEVPELVAWRIAMNFGGQAQNPFLTTLDNVKKVALNTDGLGQSVLLKGYGNEGHDSGHPDYGDIGQRIGGATDMNTLMTEGAKYGARFGVHVNASEMYPEAKAFDEDMVRRNASGGLRYGWNWLDQGVGIDGIYDLASNSRLNRFAELKAEVGDNMDFIYLDVWGNQTSGTEDSWETRKMSKMINDNGWRMTTEWGAGNEYDSTFQHWAADLTYGGKGMKGENSQVMRFLRNHQKDSWVGDYPNYGGAANAPLLGGYNMKDFEGWQGRNDYDAYVTNLFTHDVSTKFIQHFKVNRWVNSPLDPSSVQDPSVNNGNEFIELKDDSGNVVTLARGSNNSSDAAYRNRTITLNGTVISTGAVSRGDGTGTGNESYLLPWLWDAQTGEFVADKDQKLYHWNTAGGTTEWTLPSDWQNLSNVKVYKLTDLGRADEQVVAVANGKITLTADAETPYVVVKGDAAPKQINVTWSTGMHLVDAGFNGGEQALGEDWAIDGDGQATIAKSQYSNPMLKLTGTVSATQQLTDLTPGTRYAVYVGVDNRSDGDATMTVMHDGKVLATNATARSIAKNYIKAYTHNTNSATVDGTSYFQNMYVFFDAPESGEVTLNLAHKGDGDVYYDDVRVVANAYNGITTDSSGSLVSLTNDFENNAQGIWPFVISGSEGVEDNRVHLSELHAPYTQAGWDVKKMDDVLQGDWSVKINGLTQKGTLVYQTIPQNVKFDAGRKYKISFDYQSGSDGAYALAVGQGEFATNGAQLTDLEKHLGDTGHYEFEITGDVNGDSWFGIYSTSNAPDTQGTSGNAANFGGYKDFVLDNLKVERVDEEAKDKDAVEEKLKAVTDVYDTKEADVSAEAWVTYQKTLAKVRAMIDKNGANSDDFTRAYGLLEALESYMQNAPNNDGSDAYDVAADQYTVSAGSAQQGYPDEGPVDLAQDGLPGTIWHTEWGVDSLSRGNAWYQFNLNEPTTITGLRYLPRSGGDNMNGKIKKFNITLTFADGATQQIITDGTFNTATKWQKVTFPSDTMTRPASSAGVANVTSVRITATETAGSGETQINMFASAAELRLTTDRDVDPVEIPVDKTDLNALIASTESLVESDYTEDSWAELSEALAAAKTESGDEDAELYDVLLAQYNLETAIKGLVRTNPSSDVDKSALQTQVNAVQALKEADYTTESWKAFSAALTAANGVLANADVAQDEVDAALQALRAAAQALVPVKTEPEEPGQVTKSELQAAVNQAKALDLQAYTNASAAALRKAMLAAQAVLDNDQATQDEVNEALQSVQDALKALEQRPTEQSSETKDDSGKGSNSTRRISKLSRTGSDIAVIAALSIITAVAGAVALGRRRFRR